MTFLESMLLFHLWGAPIVPAEVPKEVVYYRKTAPGDWTPYEITTYTWKSARLLEVRESFPGQAVDTTPQQWTLDAQGRLLSMEPSLEGNKTTVVYGPDGPLKLIREINPGVDSTVYRYENGKVAEGVVRYVGELLQRQYLFTWTGDRITRMVTNWGGHVEKDETFTYAGDKITEVTQVQPIGNKTYTYRQTLTYAEGRLTRQDLFGANDSLSNYRSLTYADANNLRPSPRKHPLRDPRSVDALGRARLIRAASLAAPGLRLF